MRKAEQANPLHGLLSFGRFVAQAVVMLVALGVMTPCHAASTGDECNGIVTNKPLPIAAEPPDLLVAHTCELTGTLYYYNHVNIVAGGKLIFVEPPRSTPGSTQDFWATSIIIENGGQMLAGVDYDVPSPDTGQPKTVSVKPYGSNGKTLTIHLYGADPQEAPDKGIAGVPCKSPGTEAPCGIDPAVWKTNGETEIPNLGGSGVTDRFYQYGPLSGDANLNKDKTDGVDPAQGYFGYKVLALSYGGTLQLRGLKGTSGTSETDIKTLLKDPDAVTSADEKVITDSGTDWVRLSGMDEAKTTLSLDLAGSHGTKSLDWQPGDQIVVTTTDYHPDHSEIATIAGHPAPNMITLTTPLQYPHNFTKFDIAAKVGSGTPFTNAVAEVDGNTDFLNTAETRAAVALLTRSIRIVSEGDKPGEPLPAASTHYMYGGHVIFRQGFKRLQIQGVEFNNLGQGGFLGRYPVHFHLARRVPADTYVIDSSINVSMTRWIVLHSTLGVTVARNVGYKSIGHGFFLEDGTETDNKFYSNIGIFARGSVKDMVENGPNPREIPGILDARNEPTMLPLKYHSDSQYPSVFWITNGWNSFVGNMAAGAGTCGACYWFPSVANHDRKDVGTGPMSWTGYSAIQGPTESAGRYGTSPIRLFYKNYCSSAMHSLNVADGTPCYVVTGPPPRNPPAAPIPNARAPDAPTPPQNESEAAKMYYPRYSGVRFPTVCDASKPLDDADGGCHQVKCKFDDPKWCAVSTFSHYTTSFNWAGSNEAAIWLRSGYLLFDHGFVSDVQGPGLTEVTGGDYTRANLPVGYWGLTSNTIFVGQSEQSAANPATNPAMPECDFDEVSMLCFDKGAPTAYLGRQTLWMVAQRLYNIYDGPAYEDANAFLDIKVSPCPADPKKCYEAGGFGVRRYFPPPETDEGYLPNAAIAWKQSNGFYYPPAFHSRDLFFNNVDIRHYVIEPLTLPGTYKTDKERINADYWFPHNAKPADNQFDNWTDVDRQTELSDDDGTLTGLRSEQGTAFSDTISVNEDPYFHAPVQTAECKSNLNVDPDQACAPSPKERISVPTAVTSPYDHLSTAIYPKCAVFGSSCDAGWATQCSNETCYGVPIYRQYLTSGGDTNPREWEAWTKANCGGLAETLRKMNPRDPAYKTQLTTFDGMCRFPFVRMAGPGSQRSVMTANNGRYYIDTTVSEDTQMHSGDLPRPGNLNVFRPGQTYYVFFVYAKKDTKQTYQIYVGDQITEPGQVGFKGARVDIALLPLPKVKDWTTPWNAHVENGVLTVDVDFSRVPDIDKIIDPHNQTSGAPVLNDTCKPESFCSRGADNACGYNTKLGALDKLDPAFQKERQRICSHWAVKDLDCPTEGCFGFQFTLPNDFVADDRYRRPDPKPYPADVQGSPWNAIKFDPTEKANGEGCTYDASHVPGTGSCKVIE